MPLLAHTPPFCTLTNPYSIQIPECGTNTQTATYVYGRLRTAGPFEFGARGTARTTSGSCTTSTFHTCRVLIFTSVALGHDLSPRYLAWGWFAALFILSVVMALRALPSEVRPPQFFVDPSQLRMQAESPSYFVFSTLFSVCFLGNVAVSSCACCWRCL